MKFILKITLILSFIPFIYAQENSDNEQLNTNSIYLEAFGSGFCWSLNYDKIINRHGYFLNSFTIGVEYVPKSFGFGEGAYYGLPLSHNWLIGKKNHYFEFGSGLTFLYVDDRYSPIDNFSVIGIPKIGYRYQRKQGGLFFRANINLLIDLFHFEFYKSYRFVSSFSNVIGIGYPSIPWPGISLGYTFN